MAGAGKTTVGRALANQMGWTQVDTDHLIEAAYGTNLQAVTDMMTKEEFLDVEGSVLCKVDAERTVLSTGGSAVYRKAAMEHLAGLGPVVFLEVSTPIILERIARNPNRGLAIAPGQTIEDLIAERYALYNAYADFILHADELDPDQCAKAIVDWLKS
ncbi:MAG: shikimate kinase [Desulfovibrionaceae bacterium]|nr:shikimate kinase [Desulfovibrionaceae bacterium]